jgi:DNA (cytosine-5)-methyltransferase 1
MKMKTQRQTERTVLDFFAGSGLVTEGLKPYFKTIWANDVCPRKRDVYLANHAGEYFQFASIADIKGEDVPSATLSWGSFPCQDLSLAGKMEGLGAKRSGLVWQWLRVMDEMPQAPPILVAENVVGLLSASNGAHYRTLHEALRRRGYRVGPMALNAEHWVPQSRARVFVVAAHEDLDTSGLESNEPGWTHSKALIKAVQGLEDVIWWSMPVPPKRKKNLSDIIDLDAPFDPPEKSRHNVRLIPPNHLKRLEAMIQEGLKAAPGYKRIRHGRQVLELRFDDIAGCLRTPRGGSSRQFLVIATADGLKTRLLTVRETALLMGAPKSYSLPGGYNDGYHAMGDAVAVPVARYLAKNLLAPLADRLP